MYGSNSGGYELLMWSAAGIIYHVGDKFAVNYMLGMEFTPVLSSLRLRYANTERSS